jgi:hypothetical protein
MNPLRILSNLSSKTPQAISRNLPILMPSVLACFSSNKLEIKSLASLVFNQICSITDRVAVIQHLCNGGMYGLQKNKVAIIDKLNEMLANTYEA